MNSRPKQRVDDPALRNLDQSLPIALLRAREAAMASFRPMLRSHGMTEQQWRVIRILAGRGPLEVSELADATALLAPSLSRILRNLLDRGLIKRAAVRGDSRRSVVRVSAKGLKTYKSVAPEAEAIYVEIEAQFGKRRLAELLRTLDKLSEALIQRQQ